ncbi:MAG: GNAT family N-acetyltransferase [Erysipelotrichaceae bacterium]
MIIHFEPLVPDLLLAQQMLSWYNDSEIASFIEPNFKEEELHEFTVEEIFRDQKTFPTISKYLIMDDSKPIGELSITRDFPWLIKRIPETAWISIVIGDRDYWGKGVAQIAMAFIEKTCIEEGYQRIELGVFDHNHRAFRFYQKTGYHEFFRKEHFTYSNGEWHADIRMEKLI